MTGEPTVNSSPAPHEEATEVVFGFVGPLGTDNKKIHKLFAERLHDYGYELDVVQISKDIIPALVGPDAVRGTDSAKSRHQLMDFGNQIREDSKDPAILARAAAAEIGRRRPDGAVTRRAYLISSLKLKDEVAELRKIYGSGFYLFAVHTDRDQRIARLRGADGIMAEADAVTLVNRDEHEPESHGQHTRDTFALADFFVADEQNDEKLRFSINRCLDLIFGNPFVTPTFNEFAMFMAFSASLRSADLSRQVGAVIARHGMLLSTGANDCPSPGGGLYWPQFVGDRIDDAPRGRDYKRGYDSNADAKKRLIDSMVSEFRDRLEAERVLQNSSLGDITEYGRVVHAEMEALLACARSNSSCVGATLYCTTFPCHNCAKHIIAAGIEQVVYVEPYPKSRALELHDDAISTIRNDCGSQNVRFKPFIGVGPRRFFDLFSMSLSSGPSIRRKDKDGRTVHWNLSAARPRLPMLPISHRDWERHSADYLARIKRPRKEPSDGTADKSG